MGLRQSERQNAAGTAVDPSAQTAANNNRRPKLILPSCHLSHPYPRSANSGVKGADQPPDVEAAGTGGVKASPLRPGAVGRPGGVGGKTPSADAETVAGSPSGDAAPTAEQGSLAYSKTGRA